MEYYQIVYADSTQDLMRKVDSQIRMGWEPQGGVAVSGAGINVVFWQAMIRRGV